MTNPMNDLLASIRKLTLFVNLTDEAALEIGRKLEPCTLPAGEILFRQGDMGDALYIVQSGHVKIYTQDNDGHEVTLNQYGPGESFGEISLIDALPRAASVVALADSELLRLDREDFLQLLQQHPTFATDIIRDISNKLRFTVTYIQKATEWSEYIANGNYQAVMAEIQADQLDANNADSDRARVSGFLNNFLRMVERVQKRELEMRELMETMRVEIDESKRREEVTQIIESDTFREIQRRAMEIRQAKRGGNKQ